LPTHEESDQFWRDWDRLTPAQRQLFREAVKKFSDDLESLPRGQFRPGLRVKPMQGADGIFEITWEIRDGRATFEYGSELTEGDPHIVWRRVGGHAVFGAP
jgi:hypothetical protein